MILRPFQRRFVRAAFAPGIDVAALSISRGNGKSWLAAHVLARALTPGDRLYQPGAEYLLCAASIEQARIVFRFVRSALEPTGRYTFIDASNRIGIRGPENTGLRVMSSNGKTAMGIVGCPLAVCDEPGSWEIIGGQLMADALFEAQGKPGSPLRLLFIGTLAPFATGPGHWWYDLIHGGCTDTTHVTALTGDAASWDDWNTIRKVNPLVSLPGPDGAKLRRKLRQRREEARGDSRLKARFLSYRLNVPTGDESTMLLTRADWDATCARPVPDRDGHPVVGVDLGAGRAWSAAVAVWRSGRVEAVAIAPGVPDIEAQERRDRVPARTYQRLVDSGRLSVAAGVQVPPPRSLVERVLPWRPAAIVCDRFRLPELQDAAGGRVRILPRVSRWSEAAFDIRALRRAAKDGPLAVDPDSRPLLTASLAQAAVKNDDQGNVRLTKRDEANNSSRDDVAAALVLAAGARARMPKPHTVRMAVA